MVRPSEAVATWRGQSGEGEAIQAEWLRAIVTAVLVLNLFDAVLTVLWVQLGIATEANLLLAGVLERSAVLFMVVKLSLVSLGMGLLWRQRARPLAVFGIALVFCAYATLLVYHLRFVAVAIGVA
ncbi:MAG: hypothetical protein JKY37_05135 [Nannocystaceae bacterium]|nr:hypothetical protein [Nannocystaceae bacterium]